MDSATLVVVMLAVLLVGGYAVGDLQGFRVRFLREHEVLEQAPHIH